MDNISAGRTHRPANSYFPRALLDRYQHHRENSDTAHQQRYARHADNQLGEHFSSFFFHIFNFKLRHKGEVVVTIIDEFVVFPEKFANFH